MTTGANASDQPSRCPDCGGRLFHAVPGRTTVQDIRDFFATARRFVPDESGAGADWIHPGTYCTSCDYGLLVEYPLPSSGAPVDERPWVVTVTSPGPNRVQVLSELRSALGLAPHEATRLFGDGRPVTVERPWHARDEIDELMQRLTALGAVVTKSRNPG